MSRNIKRKILKVLILHAIFLECQSAYFKMTRMECKIMDKNLLRLNACRLKAVKRDIAEATVRIQIFKPVDNCVLHAELLRKYNSYQPFFINKSYDVCEFFKSRKNSVYFDILFKLIEKYTNANHTCPYEGEFVVDRFRPLHSNMILPIPTGEYWIKFYFYTSNKMIAQLLVWFGFKELENWEEKRTKD